MINNIIRKTCRIIIFCSFILFFMVGLPPGEKSTVPAKSPTPITVISNNKANVKIINISCSVPDAFLTVIIKREDSRDLVKYTTTVDSSGFGSVEIPISPSVVRVNIYSSYWAYFIGSAPIRQFQP